MAIQIRLAEERDISSCLKAQKSEGDDEFTEWHYRNAINNENVVFLVAEFEKEVVGYILGFIVPTKPTEALIHSTLINKKYRKKGIGTELIKKFAKRVFNMGVKEIHADVEDGTPFKFYKSVGFVKKGEWNWMVLKKRFK